MNYPILFSSHCRFCGVDTTVEAYVNRVSAEMDYINCFVCGICSNTLDAIADSEMDLPADRFEDYLAQRVEEMDYKYPEAIKFRTVVEVVEGQGFPPLLIPAPLVLA